ERAFAGRAQPATANRPRREASLMRRSFGLLLMALYPLWGCTQTADSPPEAAEAKTVVVPITVAPVPGRPSMRLVNLVGPLYGNEEVTLSSQVEGQIKSLQVDLGDHVEAGQVLAQIDDDQWRARLREAEATLAKAQADETRGRQLAAARIISTQEYETM